MHDTRALTVKIRERLRAGALDDKEVEIQVREAGQALGNIFSDQAFAQTGSYNFV